MKLLFILMVLPGSLLAQSDELKGDSVKDLKEAVVKGRKDIRRNLEKKWSTTGVFSEEALVYYEVNDTLPIPIVQYISNKGGRLQYNLIKDSLKDIVDAFKPIHFFLNEQQVQETDLKIFHSTDIGYIKIMEGDYFSTDKGVPAFQKVNGGPFKIPVQPTAINIIIYTKDWPTLNKYRAIKHHNIIASDKLKGIISWNQIDSLIKAASQ